MTKRHVSSAWLAGAVVLLLGTFAAQAQGTKSCHPDGKPTESEVVFNSSGGSYGDAIQKVFFTPFEQECGIKVQHVNSQRTYAQMRLYVQSGNLPWDIGATYSDQEFPLGIRDGILHKLPQSFWDSLKQELIDGSYNEYGAWATPYSELLVYSTKSTPQGIQSWADFWDVKKFPGPRIIANRPFMLIGALLADGVAPDKIYPLDIDRAFKKLDELRPSIRAFYAAPDQGVQGVANGEFVFGTTLSGRAVTAINSGQPIEMVWNGAILHNSWTFILKGTPHPRAAEALLYYMQRADRQAQLAVLTGYTGGNKNATKGLDPKVVRMLPATQEHLSVASMVDAAWWADNNAKATARWDAWVAQH